MYKRIQMGALALAVAAAAAAQPAAAEDLVQIYQQARQADPTLALAEAARGVGDAGADIARAPLLPQISASLSYAHTDGTSSSVSPEQDAAGNFVLLPINDVGRDRSRQAQGQITQSLFNWGNIETWRSAKANAQATSSDYDAAQQDLMVRTATAYFGVLTAEDQLKFAQLNEKSLQKQLDQAEQRYEVGLSAITDVHVARAQHDAAVAQVITAQNAVDTARETLIQITGKDFGDLKKLRDQLPLEKPQPVDVQSWVDLAMTRSPALASKQFSLSAASLNVSAQRSGHLPTLSASIVRTDTPSWGIDSSSIGGTSLGSFPASGLAANTTIGVTLNVPIFSGGLVSAQTRQAVFQRDSAQDQLELTRRTVVAGTRNAYRAVIAGISEVEATRQAVVSAQSGLDATQAGFEVGTKTILDVLTSQSTLVSAESSYSQARHQFVLSGLELKDSAGVLEVKDLESVNAFLE